MTEPMEPVFVDPPPAGNGSPDTSMWAATIAVLIENTSQWAKVFVGDYKDANRLVGQVRKSRGAWAGHEWEVTARNTLSSTDATVYIRHIKPLDTPNNERDEQQ
ncbi:hypothetical protein ACFYUV_20850 [Nonomuraea sp. NPDC003560]|uniref:hypothetical protein n=1 Tax=Nonomuraea sp. NPDC003560 TaxID=3364341 RepID=UPI0036BAC0A3